MRLWLLAWDNLRFNISKTVLSVLLISLATAAILIFRGYVNFTADGLRNGFVAASGAFQIAHRSYWANDTEKPILLGQEDYQQITEKLESLEGISSTTSMLAFSGLIGTAFRSTFVSGTAYETYPEGLYQKIEKESFGRLSDDGIVLGVSLLEYLQAKENDVITMLGQNDNGIALAPITILGSINIGDRNVNKVIGFSSLSKIREFYSYEHEFDRLRVDIADINLIDQNYKKINELLADTPFEAKDWLYLNPYYTDIEKYMANNSFWNTVILILLVIVSIVQMLQMSYLQRMRELGTLQAIGLTPKTVFFLLQKETFLISFMSVIVGVLLAHVVNVCLALMGATFTPPTSTEVFPLRLIFYTKDFISVSIGIIILSLLSSLYPTYQSVSKPVVEVMKNA